MERDFEVERHPLLRCLPWLACLVGMLAQFRPMVFSGFGQMHSGLGDARLVNFTFEHGWRWLRQVPPHENFWQPPIFHPHPNVSAFTDVLLGFGPLYWLPRLLGAAPDTALQWWMLLVYALNFAAGWFLLRHGVKLGVLASTAGALLTAVISVAWTPHLQLFPFFYVLTALLALLRIFDDGDAAPTVLARRGWIGVFFACAVLQLWSAIYAFFFFGLLTAVAGALALVRSRTRERLLQGLRRDAGAWLLAAALAAGATAPLVARYGMTVDETGYRHYSTETVARPWSWIVAGDEDPLLGWLRDEGGPLPREPHPFGIGLVTFCVGAAGLLAARRRRLVQVLGAATLTMMFLGTIYGAWTPWRWIFELVPGAGGIRAPHRMTMILIPGAVLGLALAFDRVAERRGVWLAVLLAAACIAERARERETIDKVFVRAHVAALAERVDPAADAFLLVGTGREAAWVDDDAAWVALATGKPAINGRYGNFPKNYEIRHHDGYETGSEEGRRALEAALQAWVDDWGMERSGVQWIEYEALTRRLMEERALRWAR